MIYLRIIHEEKILKLTSDVFVDLKNPNKSIISVKEIKLFISCFTKIIYQYSGHLYLNCKHFTFYNINQIIIKNKYN